MTRNGAVLYFRGPFTDGDGLGDLKKSALTSTGLLMEGLGLPTRVKTSERLSRQE